MAAATFNGAETVIGEYTSTAAVINSADVSAGRWLHVAMTISSTNTNKIYVDGNSVALNTNTAHTTALGSTNRANSYVGKSSFGNFFDGAIRDVRIYDNERSVNQIREDMAGFVDCSDSNLRLAFSFDGSLNGYSRPTNASAPNYAASATYTDGVNTPAQAANFSDGDFRTISLDHPLQSATLTMAAPVCTKLRLSISGLKDGAKEEMVNDSLPFTSIALGAAASFTTPSSSLSVGGQSWNFVYQFTKAAVGEDSGVLEFTLPNNAIISAAQAQTLLRNLAYRNQAPSISAGTRNFSITLHGSAQDLVLAGAGCSITF